MAASRSGQGLVVCSSPQHSSSSLIRHDGLIYCSAKPTFVSSSFLLLFCLYVYFFQRVICSALWETLKTTLLGWGIDDDVFFMSTFRDSLVTLPHTPRNDVFTDSPLDTEKTEHNLVSRSFVVLKLLSDGYQDAVLCRAKPPPPAFHDNAP